jgi:hypothetical protein
MSGRDGAGRFGTGNPWASAGGRARAAALSAERRREIAAARGGGPMKPLPGQLAFDLDPVDAAATDLARASEANGNEPCNQVAPGGGDLPQLEDDLPPAGPFAPPLPQHDLQTTGGQDLRGVYWLAFTGATPPEAARRAFRARYGADPLHVRTGLGGLLLAGPAPWQTIRGRVSP